MLLFEQSDTEAYYGHLTKAREFSRRAVELARHAGTMRQANAALRVRQFSFSPSGRCGGTRPVHGPRHRRAGSIGARAPEPTSCVARLGLARAYALQRDRAKARSAYEDFLKLWKDADRDIPTLREARRSTQGSSSSFTALETPAFSPDPPDNRTFHLPLRSTLGKTSVKVSTWKSSTSAFPAK